MPAHSVLAARRRGAALYGTLPFVILLAGWFAAPLFVTIPPYALPTLPDVIGRIGIGIADGSLLHDMVASTLRLLAGFCIGNALAIPLGIAIALNRRVSDLIRPLLTFLQSIAGIAWVPLAVIWLGIGTGAVLFVIANTIFFSSIYNTVRGVETIPPVLKRAVTSHGARGAQVLRELILPGALAQIILGLRTSMAYGWRALVAAEMIAGTNGLGFRMIEAVQWYQTDTVLVGMIVIGVLWIVFDGMFFVPLERATVRRWGLLREVA